MNASAAIAAMVVAASLATAPPVAEAGVATPAAARSDPRPALGATESGVDLPMALPPGYRLVWSDEFDRTGGPDPARWHADTSRNRQGWPNDEKEYYSAGRHANARVENGHLVIEARAGRPTRAPDYGGQEYTSARLDTQGRAAWTYGFFEVRAKLPCGRGLWPAIWMLGADRGDGWPRRGEIDIMEQVGFDPQVVHGTIHTGAYNHVIHTQRGAERRVPDACDAFHRYRLLWTHDAILIGVDDRAYMRFANDGSGDIAHWPFDRPHDLILNLAVGGGWGGQHGIDPAAFPARMVVDYVRVYQRPGAITPRGRSPFPPPPPAGAAPAS